MNIMLMILMQSLAAAIVSGALCGYIGVYLKRLRLITLGFAVAHGAIAGASIAFMLGVSMEMIAFPFGIASAVLIEILHRRFGVERDLASMFVFSMSSAIAIVAIYLTPTILLTSDVASVILWGSILSMTRERIVFLSIILLSVYLYTWAFRLELNSLLFDSKLAEAEGVNIELHTIFLVTITALTITILIRFIGGLLLFSLVYSPAIAATTITHKKQTLISSIIGSLSGGIGVIISFHYDLPIGSTITLTVCTITILAVIISFIIDRLKLKNLYRA